MEAIKQTSKINKPTAAAHAVGKNAVSNMRDTLAPQFIQTKLKINTPGDKYEREADSMADKVMRSSKEPNPIIQNHNLPIISRKCDKCKEEEIRRKEKTHQHSFESTFFESELKKTKGGGQALSPKTNAFMSRSMGADFSHVRIHTDAKAVALSRSIHAHAFTHGKDIYFDAGKYDPESSAGKHLLAHELTHVMQQGALSNKVQKKEEAIQTKTKRSSSSDPAFKLTITKVKNTAKKAKKHEPLSKKVKDAQKAAKPPVNEKASKAKDRKVAEMAQQEPGAFNEDKFKAALKAKVEALRLNTLKEAEDFKKNNGAEALKGDMGSQVSNEKKAAAENIDNKTKEQPNASKEVGKEVGAEPTVEKSVSAESINGAEAAPKPVAAEDISLKKESQSLDTQMSEAKVTDTQLAKSNEPKFNKALNSKKSAQQNSTQAPQQFRKDEKGMISLAQVQVSGQSKAQMAEMVGTQKKQVAKVLSKQQIAKVKEEQNRAKIAADIEQKFAATKTDVEAILTKLDTDVNTVFDQGIADATKQFHNYVDAEVLNYKFQRYLGNGGLGLVVWGYDLLKGPPEEINEIYKKGKNVYIQNMDVVIGKVAKMVSSQLTAAKKRIAAGKLEIKNYVESLPKDLQKIGAEAAKNIQSQFNELSSSVDSKENELIDSLANKYKAGLDHIDSEIEAMKEANKGLVDVAKGAINEVINTIKEFNAMLQDVLARASEAIDLIVADPIGFLGNLVAGIKLGVQNFAGNILTHLKTGLMGWLFGTLANAGIEVPKTFDFKGILSLILQVLGLTYANIRSRAVNIVGEKVVAGLEKAAEIFIIIKNEGIGGLWRFIKEKVEDLKETVISSIKDFVVTKIITAGVTWLISMLNPASAFVKACKMIYDVIMFFINRGKQIMELVNAVINSVTAIAKGNIAVAATFVENALSKALPVAISFLASLLGLDGISEKIKAIIAKIQAPINKAIDWVINKAVALVKGVAGLFSGGKDKPKDEKSVHSPEKQAKIDAGLITMHQEQAKYLKNGKISKEDAQKVANSVKSHHSVFSSFKVKGKEGKIDFVYTASPEKIAESIDEVEVKEEVGSKIHETFNVPKVNAKKSEQNISEGPVQLTKQEPKIRELLKEFWKKEINDAYEEIKKDVKKEAKCKNEIIKFKKYINNISNNLRPTANQSEREMAFLRNEYLGSQVTKDNWQPSYKGEHKANYGTKDSVRPDWKEGEYHIESKRYFYKNKNKLIAKLKKQIEIRRKSLPSTIHGNDMKQQAIMIDFRGQKLPPQDIINLKQEISKATNVRIDMIDIIVWGDEN